MNIITDIPGQLSKLPTAIVIALCSIVFGVMLKKAKFFPNRFIPWFVVPFNAVWYWYLGNPGSISPDMRHPECALWLYGIILGFFAWGAHAFLLKKLAALLPTGVLPESSFDTDETVKPKETDEKPKTP